MSVLLNIPAIFTSPKAGSSGEKGAVKSEEAAGIEEQARTAEAEKTEENKEGVWTSKRSRSKNRRS